MRIENYYSEDNAVLICDLDGGGVKHSHNVNKPFKTASIIKIHILAYYLCEGKLKRAFEVPPNLLTEFSLMTELGITKTTLREALVYMMAFSDNSATNALIESAGYDKLNRFCREVLKTENTVIGRKMLDTEAEARGEDNLSSLEDCRRAMQYVLSFEDGRDIMRRHKGRERLMRYIFDPPGLEYYGKYGNIPDVYNDIAVFRKEESSIFAGVLSYRCDINEMNILMGKAGLAALGAERPLV